MNNEIITQMDNFFYNVAWLRRQYGFSKKHMAQLLGIGVGSLNKLEKGELPPMMCIDVLYEIHKYFGIAMADLFGKRLGE